MLVAEGFESSRYGGDRATGYMVMLPATEVCATRALRYLCVIT